MDFPPGILVPNEAGAVAAAGDDVQFAVAVHVCGKNVGGTGMLAGQAMFLERLGGILPRLPPCEPFALAGFDRRSALGGEGDVEPAVTVEVAGPEVMAQAGRVVLGEHVTCPPIGLAGILRHLQPDGGVGKFASRLGAVGKEIEFAVSVHVRLEHTVDADDFVLGNASLPRTVRCVLVRLLEPHDESGLIARADEVRIAIAVHVERFAVDEGVILVVADNDLLPARCDKQPSFATGIADDIHLAITGEVGRHRNVVMQSLPDDVAFPIALRRSFNAGQDERLNEQNPQNAHDVIDCLRGFGRIGMIVTQRNRLCTNHNDRVRFLKFFLLKKKPTKMAGLR